MVVFYMGISNKSVAYILCKNFNETHSELLEIFYSYIQVNNPQILLKFMKVLYDSSLPSSPDNIGIIFHVYCRWGFHRVPAGSSKAFNLMYCRKFKCK